MSAPNTVAPVTREEVLLAAIAGDNVSVSSMTPPVAVSNIEKIMQNIEYRIDTIEGKTVTKAAAIADISEAPTASDFNNLLAKLRTAGVIKTA